jgi:hypothetical protein
MTGSNVRGMTGSNVRGMTGSNVRGMTGSNVRGMTGSNVRGMTGSNVRGMTGSNVRGMTGSNVRGMTGSNVRSEGDVSLRGEATFGDGFDLAVMGPVELIGASSTGGAQVTVAGVTVDVDALDAGELNVGDYVVVGALSASSPAIYAMGIPYIPGVSTVRLRGAVNGVDAGNGTVSIAGAVVDYTSALVENPQLSIAVGDTINVGGTLPATGASLIADYGALTVVEGE